MSRWICSNLKKYIEVRLKLCNIVLLCSFFNLLNVYFLSLLLVWKHDVGLDFCAPRPGGVVDISNVIIIFLVNNTYISDFKIPPLIFRLAYLLMSYRILQIDPMHLARLLHTDPTMLIGCHAQSILQINLDLWVWSTLYTPTCRPGTWIHVVI